jgi:hypothetical protein
METAVIKRQVALFVLSRFTPSVRQGETWELVSFVCTENLTTVLTKDLLLLSDMRTLSKKKKKGYSSYCVSLLHFHFIKYDACLYFQQHLKAELPLGIGQFVDLSYSPKLFPRFEGPQVPIVKIILILRSKEQKPISCNRV